MPYIRTLLTFAVFLLPAVTSCSQESPAARTIIAGPDISRIIVGTYLNKKYQESLALTRSPRAANEASQEYGYRQYLTIQKSQGQLNISFYTFHEGIGTLVIDAQGVSRKQEGVKGISHITTPTAGRIAVTISDQTEEFEYVSNINSFVISKTIAGSYIGSDGKRYSFTEAGVASFPNREFRMVVDTDPYAASGGFDRVVNLDVERGPDNYLGFKWDSNKLKIYEDVLKIGADFQSEFKEPPLVVLSPIGAP